LVTAGLRFASKTAWKLRRPTSRKQKRIWRRACFRNSRKKPWPPGPRGCAKKPRSRSIRRWSPKN